MINVITESYYFINNRFVTKYIVALKKIDNQTFDLKGQASNKDWCLVKEENCSFVSVLYPSARIVCHQRVLNKVMFANYVPKSPEVWSHCLRKIFFSPVIVQFGQLSPLAKKKTYLYVKNEWRLWSKPRIQPKATESAICGAIGIPYSIHHAESQQLILWTFIKLLAGR